MKTYEAYFEGQHRVVRGRDMVSARIKAGAILGVKPATVTMMQSGLFVSVENDKSSPILAKLRAENFYLKQALNLIDSTLRVPAAKYVPAISDVFEIIDRSRKNLPLR